MAHPINGATKAVFRPSDVDYPVLRILEGELEKGAQIVKQDGRWHLFASDGEGIASGETIKDMLVNLVFELC